MQWGVGAVQSWTMAELPMNTYEPDSADMKYANCWSNFSFNTQYLVEFPFDQPPTETHHGAQMSSKSKFKSFIRRISHTHTILDANATAEWLDQKNKNNEEPGQHLIFTDNETDNNNENPHHDLIRRIDSRDAVFDPGATSPTNGPPARSNDHEEREQKADLCQSCSGISPSLIHNSAFYILHWNARSLKSSSHSCHLCRLVRHQLRSVLERAFRDHGFSTITLRAHKLPGRLWLHAYGLHLGELQWFADPTGALSLSIPLAHPQVNTKALSQLGGHIEDCFHDRGACYNRLSLSKADTHSGPPFLPRRVIDVGDLNAEHSPNSLVRGLTVRLHESAKDERAHYTTLSHRWGNKLICQTTLENIKAHCDGIDFGTLPTSFQDAVTVTRAVGVRYLWIDALCIIQDDHSDWIDQAPLMGKIYNDARCTIAAHSARDSTIGFLKSTSSLNPVMVGPYSGPKVGTGTLYIGIPRSFKEAVDFSYIKQRGWVLQELTLSQRIAHFSNGYIYYDCPHMTTPRSIGHIADQSTQASTAMKALATRANFVESWIDLVTEYSKCELTYGTDKLVAIAGIATEWKSRLKEGVGMPYNSGLFECTLPHGLLWYSGGGERLTKRYNRAPSWSWASVDGHLQFMNTRWATVVATFKMEDTVGNDGAITRSHQGQLIGHASITKARIVIVRERVDFGAETITAENFLRPHGARIAGSHLEIPGSKGWAQASLDGGSRLSKSVYCARVCTFTTSWGGCVQQRDFLLILKRVIRRSVRYKRIGVGTFLSDTWHSFDWPSPQAIVII